MTLIEKANRLRAQIEVNADSMDDEEAADYAELFPKWSGDGVNYKAGCRVTNREVLYKCLADHVSQESWNPDDAPSLWAKVLNPDPEVIPEWEQPGSTNPYMKGDKVKHNGKTWVSTIDNNVWEPGVYGWEEDSSQM